MSYCSIMDEHLFLVQSNFSNVVGVYDLTFTGPNSAIICDIYDVVGTQIRLLVEFSFPDILK